ncbi:MAG: alanine racemase [Pseudomonadota bacterium]
MSIHCEQSPAATAIIDTAALAQNLVVARRMAHGARCMAVVKANAYGHGLVECARALSGADALAVARLSEAKTLRHAHATDLPIVVLDGALSADETSEAVALGCELVVHSDHQLQWLEAAEQVPSTIWLKVNTGMNRLGWAPAAVAQAYARIVAKAPEVDVRFSTHFASADDPDAEQTDEQLQRWQDLSRPENATISLSNSAALVRELGLRAPTNALAWVRPGLLLYGATPFGSGDATDLGLTPVMNFESSVIAVQRLRTGDRVGYGGGYTAAQDMRIGVVAAGYGDGYPCQMPAGTPVLVDGRNCMLAGRVSMDMLSVDLTGAPEAQVGSRVRLWGQELPVERVARHANTIAWELLTRVSARVERVFT